ncbi:APA family basic amino acid/polyamine antiporter [Polymorphobacter multimanifer]|uniref:APA family basic amino acid/polyamine antiporter n=1 Tax=Polymorphobacter multimanifer TaxID=1070431 RepID=A0A841L360_9SPHN|nr:amino acid permease [Polymorphobacter multimanifer]MBB6226850.1 APA family basic amino acid/polyamine antiporter [Polymorphobacter multimanifer]
MADWRVKSLDSILATAEKKSLTRSLGAFQLTMLGIGGIIGTGIFVLTSEAAQLAGPAMLLSFVIAATVCGLAALCYAELASMVPVSGSAYTYSYATFGELMAWIVGWALVLEYAVAASAVAVGWSGYAVGVIQEFLGYELPFALTNGPYAGGLINLPAVIISIAVTALLVVGTKESATVNAVLVVIKVAALTAFVVLALPAYNAENFVPFMPLGSTSAITAASIIFFAYVGFDAVSTAAEETKDPQRNIPIGLIGSLVICTVFYLAVGVGVIGSYGAQPVGIIDGTAPYPGTPELVAACNADTVASVVCSNEALAHVLRSIGHPGVGNLLGLAAGFALPSVILMMMFAQTRVFFVMSRDGLLPRALSKVHPKFKTPHIVTMITGAAVTIGAAFFPVGQLASISNGGTLCAFFFVALAILVLRRTQPDRKRSFRTPAVWVIAPAAIVGCLVLFAFLSWTAIVFFFAWAAIGIVFYFAYGRSRSNVALGIDGVSELDPDIPPQGVPPLPGIHTPGGKDA